MEDLHNSRIKTCNTTLMKYLWSAKDTFLAKKGLNEELCYTTLTSNIDYDYFKSQATCDASKEVVWIKKFIVDR